MVITTRGNSISLHPLMIKLLKARKTVLEKDFAFDKVFNNFYETDNSHNKLQMYNPKTTTMINRKNEMLQYLEI